SSPPSALLRCRILTGRDQGGSRRLQLASHSTLLQSARVAEARRQGLSREGPQALRAATWRLVSRSFRVSVPLALLASGSDRSPSQRTAERCEVEKEALRFPS